VSAVIFIGYVSLDVFRTEKSRFYCVFWDGVGLGWFGVGVVAGGWFVFRVLAVGF